jgi:hypothetical protein
MLRQCTVNLDLVLGVDSPVINNARKAELLWRDDDHHAAHNIESIGVAGMHTSILLRRLRGTSLRLVTVRPP